VKTRHTPNQSTRGCPQGCRLGIDFDTFGSYQASMALPSFTTSELAVLDKIEHQLRADGWADRVTVPYLLQRWQKLSSSVDRYMLTVDDYTNNLCARDGLEIVLAGCQEPLRAKLRLVTEEADKEFLAKTQEGVGHALGRYFRIGQSSGWWWKRTPATGPLAELLNRRR
jgi:hypothetical protein